MDLRDVLYDVAVRTGRDCFFEDDFSKLMKVHGATEKDISFYQKIMNLSKVDGIIWSNSDDYDHDKVIESFSKQTGDDTQFVRQLVEVMFDIHSATEISDDYNVRLSDKGILSITKYLGNATILRVPNVVLYCGQVCLVKIIDSNAFEGCSSLQTIEIPDSVTYIATSFHNCKSLKSIVVSPNNNYYSSIDGVLFNKELNVIECYPEGISEELYSIPDSVTEIGSFAFSDCTSLHSVIISDSVEKIDFNAFKNCTSIKSISIPSSVLTIECLFDNCTSLQSFEVHPDNERYNSINGVLFNKELNVIERYPQGRVDESYVIPDVVREIGDDAFAQCTSLHSITIPCSVEKIGNGSFVGCSSLKSIAIPDSVTQIGWLAFNDCTSLRSIKIPSDVECIDRDVFDGCSSLQSIEVSSNNNNYSSINGILFDKEQSIILKYPEGIVNDTYCIPNTVNEIKDKAFHNCSSLQSIEIPDSVVKIGKGAFSGCTSIQSIKIPDSVIWISGDAFDDCALLKTIDVGPGNGVYSSINGILFDKEQSKIEHYPEGLHENSYFIPESVETIAEHAFYKCKSLQIVEIPKSIKNIGIYAFYECISIQSITIPDSVVKIGRGAFSGCTSLQSVKISKAKVLIEIYAFTNCPNLRTIFVPMHTKMSSHSFDNDIEILFEGIESLKNECVTDNNSTYLDIIVRMAHERCSFAIDELITYFNKNGLKHEASQWFIDGYERGLKNKLLKFKREETILLEPMEDPIIPDYLEQSASEGNANSELMMYILLFWKNKFLEEKKSDIYQRVNYCPGDYFDDREIVAIQAGEISFREVADYEYEARTSSLSHLHYMENAHEWLNKSALHGNSDSQLLAALLTEDKIIKIELLKQSALGGNSNAMLLLSDEYVTGEAVKRSLEQSIDFCRRSSQLGNVAAKLNLAFAYHTGVGVVKSISMAAKLYKEVIDVSRKDRIKLNRIPQWFYDVFSYYTEHLKEERHGKSIIAFLSRYYSFNNNLCIPSPLESYCEAITDKELEEEDLVNLYWPSKNKVYIYDVSERTIEPKLIYSTGKSLMDNEKDLLKIVWHYYLNNATDDEIINLYWKHEDEIDDYDFFYEMDKRHLISRLIGSKNEKSLEIIHVLACYYYSEDDYQTSLPFIESYLENADPDDYKTKQMVFKKLVALYYNKGWEKACAERDKIADVMIPTDDKMSPKELKFVKSLTTGFSEEWYSEGYNYECGIKNHEMDFKKAKEYYLKAALLNNRKAMIRLDEMYFDGKINDETADFAKYWRDKYKGLSKQ